MLLSHSAQKTFIWKWGRAWWRPSLQLLLILDSENSEFYIKLIFWIWIWIYRKTLPESHEQHFGFKWRADCALKHSELKPQCDRRHQLPFKRKKQRKFVSNNREQQKWGHYLTVNLCKTKPSRVSCHLANTDAADTTRRKQQEHERASEETEACVWFHCICGSGCKMSSLAEQHREEAERLWHPNLTTIITVWISFCNKLLSA